MRGKANIVQVFDQYAGQIEQGFDLSEQIESPIRGLHTLGASGTLYKHIVVDEAASCYAVDHDSGALDSLFKLKGSHVTRTYMMQSRALAQGSLKTNPELPASQLLVALSKGTPIQVWDVEN